MKPTLTAFALLCCIMPTACKGGGHKASQEPDRDSGTPGIKFEFNKFSLGEIQTDTIASPRLFVFTFTNSGNADLHILECHTNCRCLKVERPQGAIKPGEKGEIKAWFDFTGQPGGGFKKSVTVITDAEPPLRALYIEGKAKD